MLHGDNDPIVPLFNSEQLMDAIEAADQGDRAQLHVVPGAGHGSHEFFQPAVKRLMLDFLEAQRQSAQRPNNHA